MNPNDETRLQQAAEVAAKPATRIYDLPTRLFHGLFAVLFLTAYALADWLGDDSPYFNRHMLIGLMLAFMVLLRIVWGIAGSRWARFSSFPLQPARLAAYLVDVFRTSRFHYSGHNPASAWAGLIMMALALGLAFTGWQMASGGENETLEDLHELMANLFMAVTAAHLAGLAWHAVKHRDGLAFSMVHGRKTAPAADGIRHSYTAAGLVFLALYGLFGWNLMRGFDPAANTLSLFGTTLQLGENEGAEEESGEQEGNAGQDDEEKEEEDDDD